MLEVELIKGESPPRSIMYRKHCIIKIKDVGTYFMQFGIDAQMMDDTGNIHSDVKLTDQRIKELDDEYGTLRKAVNEAISYTKQH